MQQKIIRQLRLLFVFALALSLSGCFYWWRAYQTYQQMHDFDTHFAISVSEEFTVHFKDPILYNEDFISLAKLKPSGVQQTSYGQLWKYHFHKVDKDNHLIAPGISFSFDLGFNQDNRIIAWSFSPLFLEIAPPEFLELSFRSLGAAEINEGKRQLKVNTEKVAKIDADLPLKSVVLAKLGEPLNTEQDKNLDIFIYHFQLEAYEVEEGYEERTLSEIKLSFDKQSSELVKMTGRFAGLKISIDYRKYQQQQSTEPAV
jgi:hypothetical protein